METTLLIEAEGQPSVTIIIEAPPEIIFQDTGVQGPIGPALDIGDMVPLLNAILHQGL